MGLLDFLSSSKPAPTQSAARPNALVVKPGSPQSGVIPTPAPTSAPYKEVQYPIPSNTDQLGATVPPEPTGLVAKNTPAALPSVNANVESQVETNLDNGVRQVNHQDDIKPVDNTTPVPALPELNTSNAQYTYTNTPLPAEALVPVSEPLPEVASTLEATSTENLGNPLPPVEEPTSVTETTPVVQPTEAPLQPLPELTPPQPEIAPVLTPEPAVEGKTEDVSSPVSDIIEIGTPTPAEEMPTEVAPAVNPVVEAEPEVPTAPAVEEPKLETSPEPTVESATTGMTVLKKIAFVSLNSQGVNSSVSKNVKTIAESLKTMNVEVLIDSNKGYGMDVISGLSGTSNKVTAVYLKPFRSKYSDEATINVPLSNLTSVNFSTVLSRIRFIYRNSSAFIVPETSGLANLAQLTFLLNTQAMYPGMAKPVILLGTAWKNRITALKDNFALTQQEVDTMYYASNAEEALNLLKKLDGEFTSKTPITGATVDLRSEGAEIDGLLVQ